MIRLSGQTRLSTSLRGNGEWIYVPPVPVFVDRSYGPFSQGVDNTIFYNNNSLVYDPASNGYYVLGAFPYYGNQYVGRILRLDQTGSRDPNFNSGVGLGPPAFNGGVVTSDGKLVVFSQAGNYSGSNQSGNVFRINSNGTFDSTFSQGSANITPILSMCQQSDGKILIGGSFTTYSGSSSNRIVRINPSGTVDSDFNIGTGFGGLASNRVYAIVTQSDGKILVGGDFTVYNGVSSSGIVRLFPSGGIDPDFYTGSGFTGVTTDIVNSIAVQSDGKILVGGNYTSYSGSATNRIVRLTPSGTIDLDFNVGAGLGAAPFAILQQTDGKIVVGGNFTTYSGSTRNFIVRINPSGSIDSDFNIGTLGFNGTVRSLYLQSDGKIVVKGQFRTYSGSTEPNYDGLIRLNPSGTIDTTFVNRGVLLTVPATTTNYGLCQQSDGKIIVGGEYIRYSSSVANRIQRLNVDGTRDSSFNVGTGFNNVVYSVAQQSDGKILAVGSFSSYSGSSINRIVRLNPSGTIDTTLNTGLNGFSSAPNSIVTQSEGKIVVVGNFTTYSGSTPNFIVRINPSGSVDTTFNSGTGTDRGFNASVVSIIPLQNGNTLAYGPFVRYSGSFAELSSYRGNLVEITPSGSIARMQIN